MGVTMLRLMRSALPNSGTRMRAARTALCKRMEMARARRVTRRSRMRCSASPSTRHPLKDPRLSLGLGSETLRGSDDITHLHNFFCEDPGLCGPAKRNHRKFCGAAFLGVALDVQETGTALAGMIGCARPHCVGHQ